MLPASGVWKTNIRGYISFLCVPVDVCVVYGCGAPVSHSAEWSSEENLQGCVLSFHTTGPRDKIQGSKLGFRTLSLPTDPSHWHKANFSL